MNLLGFGSLFAAICGLPAVASAQETTDVEYYEDETGIFSNLELALTTGFFDRSTTGVGAPLDAGYDTELGVGAGVDVRLFFDDSNEYFRHGIVLAGTHERGPFFGLGGYGFAWTEVDAGYSVRALFPCMSGETVKWYGHGTVALSGVIADAGLGQGDIEQGDRATREALAESLDHGAVGFRLALGVDVHVDSFLIGLTIDMREYFGLDTAAERSSVRSAMLRTGVDFSL
jgi:hypothetical protein